MGAGNFFANRKVHLTREVAEPNCLPQGLEPPAKPTPKPAPKAAKPCAKPSAKSAAKPATKVATKHRSYTLMLACFASCHMGGGSEILLLWV